MPEIAPDTPLWGLYARCKNTAYRLIPRRNRLIQSIKTLRIKPNANILNIGFDEAFLRDYFKKQGTPVSLRSVHFIKPLRVRSLKKLRKNDPASSNYLSPTAPLPFRSSSFDRILVNTFTGRVNRIFLLNEVKRVLKSNGSIMFVDKKSDPRNSFSQALIDNELSVEKNQGNPDHKIYVSNINSNKSADAVTQSLRDFSSQFELQYPTTQPQNEKIVNITLEDLKTKPHFIDQLAVSYQQIFGSADIWAEGAYCDRDRNHLISLEEYLWRFESKDLTCPCGGFYKPCYSKKYFVELITSQLRKSDKFDPFCSLYLVDNQVRGFIWGVVGELEACKARVLKTPNWVDKSDWQDFIGHVFNEFETSFGLTTKTKVLYIDDLGLMPKHRKGVEPMMALIHQGFSHAIAAECQKAFCWTSQKSPLFRIAKYAAFKEVLVNKDKIVFMYCDDIVPTFKILQHDPRSMLPLMIKIARLTEGKAKVTK